MLLPASRKICALAAKLFAAGQGAARLDLVLTRADNEMQALSVRLAAPSAEADHLARLLTTRLERMSRGLTPDAGLKPYVLRPVPRLMSSRRKPR